MPQPPNKIKYYSGQTVNNSIKNKNFILGINNGAEYGPTSSTGFWNGISPPTNGYTIYGNKPVGGPAIFVANNDTQLINFANGMGGVNITGVTQALTHYHNSNLLCVNRDYEDIVTSGLTFLLDAGFTLSYPRSGTTWTDLSYNGYNGTLINGPSYNTNGGGSIVFDGVDDYVVTPSFALSSSTSCLSFNFWVKSISQTSTTQSILGKDTNTGGVPHILIRRVSNSDNLGFNFQTSGGSSLIQFSNFFTGYDNTWVNLQIVADYNNKTVAVYRNGSFYEQQNQPGAIFPNTNTVMYLSSFAIVAFLPFYGNIAIAQIYDRPLSTTEISSNYNAQSTRFTITPTPTISPTPTPTPTPTISPTPTPTITPTPTSSPTPTPTPTSTSGRTFSQAFTGATAPSIAIETAWNVFRTGLTGSYTQFVWSSTNGNSITVSDATLVQSLANGLRTATVTAVTINSVSWRVGTGCGTPKIGGVAVEFSNIASCNASSTYALRPMINNSNWGGTNQSTVGAPSQTITLTFS